MVCPSEFGVDSHPEISESVNPFQAVGVSVFPKASTAEVFSEPDPRKIEREGLVNRLYTEPGMQVHFRLISILMCVY